MEVQHAFADNGPTVRRVTVREHERRLKPLETGQPPPKKKPKHRACTATSHNMQLVSLALMQRGAQGATDEELEALTGLRGNSVRPRRRELVQVGRVKASDETRPTTLGGTATVWLWAGGAL